MTTGHPAGYTHAFSPRQPTARYLRCARCGVAQPVVSSTQVRCASCGAPLQRWIAHPPPTSDPAIGRRPSARPASSRLPYLGPPTYQGGHPRWSFPSVVWKDLPEPATPPVRDPAPGLRLAAWLAAVTAVAAGCAAAAEGWRFVLMLRARTEVLPGSTVRASDVLVAASGLAVVLSALATAVVAVPAMVRAHAQAARRLGRAPSRSSAAVAARLLVPVWNVYGAGQIAVEVDRMLQGAACDEPAAPARVAPSGLAPSGMAPSRLTASRLTASRLIALWWCGWILSAVLVMAALARGWGGSLQAIADTVELHIAVDLAAALVGALTFLVLRRFARLLDGPRSPLAGWVVQPPAPTRPLAQDEPAAQPSPQEATPPATEQRGD